MRFLQNWLSGDGGGLAVVDQNSISPKPVNCTNLRRLNIRWRRLGSLLDACCISRSASTAAVVLGSTCLFASRQGSHVVSRSQASSVKAYESLLYKATVVCAGAALRSIMRRRVRGATRVVTGNMIPNFHRVANKKKCFRHCA